MRKISLGKGLRDPESGARVPSRSMLHRNSLRPQHSADAILRLGGVACHRAPPCLFMPRSPTDTGCTPQWISTRPHAHRALSSGKSIFMPASIVLSGLAWSTPDGRPLFSHLDLELRRRAHRPRRPQRRRQDHAAAADRRRAAARMPARSPSAARSACCGRPSRTGPDETVADLFGATDGAGAAAPRRAGDGDSRRARRRRLDAGGADRRGARPARARRARRHAAGDAVGRAAHARRRSPRWSSPSPTSSCSTSRPTISTATAARR